MLQLSHRNAVLLAALLLSAVSLRLGVVVVQFDKLGIDRDGYREIARHVADGEGYSHRVGGNVRPTAYRPPLYPLVLAALFRVGAGDVGIAALHVLLGVGTVLFTYVAGVRLGLGAAAYYAAGLVAVDPLLLQYTALPMTEVLCTFLVTWLLVLLVGCPVVRPVTFGKGAGLRKDSSPVHPSRLKWVHVGVVFGLCLLCRPTIGAFALLGGICWLIAAVRRRGTVQQGADAPRSLLAAWPALLAAGVVIFPWALRNQLVMGRPVATTTHGGYTLLLGNNSIFYREVVGRPLGTVWDDAPAGRTQAAWLKEIEAELRAELGPLANDEPSRDRWMYRRARQNIAAEPGFFVRACLLRFLRFWNIVPLSPARGGILPVAVWGIGLLYSLEIALFICGAVLIVRRCRTTWISLLLMTAVFSLVHLFYWSNMRMRAPVIPAIALVGALVVSRDAKALRSESRRSANLH